VAASERARSTIRLNSFAIRCLSALDPNARHSSFIGLQHLEPQPTKIQRLADTREMA